MANSGGLVVQVQPGDDEDAGELAELTGWLQDELLDLDVNSVDTMPEQDVPDGAKGIAALAGWLAVNLGPEALKTVLAKVADWATRNDRAVEVTIAGQNLKLARATRQQQQELIDAFLARLPVES
jgi:hypothetical protein